MIDWRSGLILSSTVVGAVMGQALTTEATLAAAVSAAIATAATAGLATWALVAYTTVDDEDVATFREQREVLRLECGRLADRLDLIRGVFDASAELVGCVTEDDARSRFAGTLRRYWSYREAYLLLWERGAWRSLGGQAAAPPPDLSQRVRLPQDPTSDGTLVLDLSSGVEGQAALVLRGGQPQPTLDGWPIEEQRKVAEVLAGQLALSLRRVVLYRSLQALARHDQLTTCCRRWYGEARLREICDQGQVVSVAILDLDHFKEVNDHHGHHVGDQVLTAVGKCLMDTIRGQDLVCRWGGEEFLVLLPGTDPTGAELAVRRLRSAIANLRGLPVRVTISGGIASCTTDETAEELVGRADSALLVAKHEGRDRAVLAPPPKGTTVRIAARRPVGGRGKKP